MTPEKIYNHISPSIFKGCLFARFVSVFLAIGGLYSHSLAADIVPPYSHTFDTEYSLNGYVTVNSGSNGDWQWDYYTKWARSKFGIDPVNSFLVLPSVQLMKDYVYTFSYRAASDNYNNAERTAAWVGTELTEDALSQHNLIAVTDVKEVPAFGGVKLQGNYVAPADGDYYFAIQHCSPANTMWLYVNAIEISKPYYRTAPQALSNLTITADSNSALKTTLNASLPQKTMDDTPITGLYSVLIERNNEAVATLAISAGQTTLEWTDDSPQAGENKYVLTPYVEQGAGPTIEKSVWVGPNTPESPEKVAIVLGEDNGVATVSWSPVTLDIEGKPVDEIAYDVYRILGAYEQTDLVSAGQESTSFTERICAKDAEPTFVYYAIRAHNEAGESVSSFSTILPIGKAYSAPYVESFPAEEPQTMWFQEHISGSGYFDVASDETNAGVTSQDLDNGYVTFTGFTTSDCARFYSGRIAIPEDWTDPVMSFYYFTTVGNTPNEIDIDVNTGDGFRTLKKFELTADNSRWQRATVALEGCTGKEVQLGLTVYSKGKPLTAFDHITVYNRCPVDLGNVALSLPSVIKAGVETEGIVQLTNLGVSSAEDYKVQLICEDDVLTTINGQAITAGEDLRIPFTAAFSILLERDIKIYPYVSYADDQSIDNNAGPEIEVSIQAVRGLPIPTCLDATDPGTGVRMAWSAPDMDELPPMATTEDFESYPTKAFSNNDIYPWMSIDQDFTPCIGFSGMDLTGIKDNLIGFFVMDESLSPSVYDFRAYSGTKYMGSVDVSGTTVPNNDWLISPRLTGEAQEISYAASTVYDYGTLELLVSFTDSNLNSFQTLLYDDEVYPQWVENILEIPEGTRYVAWRNRTLNGDMMCLDDITLIREDGPKMEATLLGYNIYRNGHLIAQTDDKCEYVDLTGMPSDVYLVTSRYDKGESRPSNAVALDRSGMESAVNDEAMQIATQGLTISVKGVNAFSVYAIDGRLCAADCRHEWTAPQHGVYIVRTHSAAHKVVLF